MELLFQVCFFVGIGLTLFSLVIGHFADILDMDLFDLDAGGVDFFLPLNPMIYVLGSTVFGGVGLILLNLFPQFPIFFIPSIALIVAILISTCFYKLTALGNSELPMYAVFFYIFFLSFTSKIQHKNVFLCIKVLDKSSKLCGAPRQSSRNYFSFRRCILC